MPTSHAGQINEVLELILATNPSSLLDVGVGLGKYGVLAREYLETWHAPSASEWRGKPAWARRIDGIEAHKRYLSPLHEYVYNQIFVGDALALLPRIEHRYDLLLLIDILEHFTFEDGQRLLMLCRQRARNVIISTPKDIGEQGESWGNPYEVHRFQWTIRHLRTRDAFIVPNDDSLICFFGEDARASVRASLWKSAVKRQVPYFIKEPFWKIKRAAAAARGLMSWNTRMTRARLSSK